MQLKGSAVEGYGAHEGLAAVPAKEHVGGSLRFNIFFNEFFKHLVGYNVALLLLVQIVLLKIVAVLATQVAKRAGWLEHHV